MEKLVELLLIINIIIWVLTLPAELASPFSQFTRVCNIIITIMVLFYLFIQYYAVLKEISIR